MAMVPELARPIRDMLFGMARALTTHLTVEPQRVPDALFPSVLSALSAMESLLQLLPSEPGASPSLADPDLWRRAEAVGATGPLRLDEDRALSLCADAHAMIPDLVDTMSWVAGNASADETRRYTQRCQELIETLRTGLLEPIYVHYPELRPSPGTAVARVLRWS